MIDVQHVNTMKNQPPTVKIANGETETALQTIQLPISIGCATFHHPTHVFQNLPVPLLIGDDFLELHKNTLIFNGTTAELTLIEEGNTNN